MTAKSTRSKTTRRLSFFALVISAACGGEKRDARPPLTEPEPTPSATAVDVTPETTPDASAETRVAGAQTSGEAAQRFADAANRGDLPAQEALSAPDCWQKECGSFAQQAGKKFKVVLGHDLQSIAGRAVFDADIVCDGDRKCDSVHLLLASNGGGEWQVFDITEDDRKASDWVKAGADPLRVGDFSAVGSSQASGGKVSNLQAVLKKMRVGLRGCYSRALKSDPNASGAFKVTVKIAATGVVDGVTTTSTGNLPPTMKACIEGQVRAARFDPPSGGPTSITIPLVFAHN